MLNKLKEIDSSTSPPPIKTTTITNVSVIKSECLSKMIELFIYRFDSVPRLSTVLLCSVKSYTHTHTHSLTIYEACSKSTGAEAVNLKKNNLNEDVCKVKELI